MRKLFLALVVLLFAAPAVAKAHDEDHPATFNAQGIPLVKAAAAISAGSWSGTFNLPNNYAIHSVLMHTGKVLYWSYPLGNTPYTGAEGQGLATATVWDPTKGTGSEAFKEVSPPGSSNIWCSGESVMADGRVLVTGGNERYSQDLNGDGDVDDPGEWHHGSKHIFIFDPVTETWSQGPDMRQGRWYPTQTLLPDGDTMIMSGLTEHGDHDNNPDVEIYHPDTNTLTLLGTRVDGPGTKTTPPNGDAYPHVFANILGKTVLIGPAPNDSWAFNSANPLDFSGWLDLPNDVNRYAGAAVIDPFVSSTLHAIGGSPGGGTANTTPWATSTKYDIATGTAVDDPAMKLNIGRAHLNVVLMPDRTMVTLGGGLGLDAGVGRRGQWEGRDAGSDTGHSRRQIELFDPAVGHWVLGPAQAEDRTYHSTALLLPDGRVFSGGDDVNGTNGDGIDPIHDTGQMYTPAYLDGKATRPQFTIAPQGMVTGKAYEFASTEPITSAVLMAPSAVTHANDMNQRVVAVNLVNGKLVVPEIPVPGYYMLFGLNAAGTPTQAVWVQLGKDIPAVAVTPPADPAPPVDTPVTPGTPVEPIIQNPPSVNPPKAPGQTFTPPVVNPEVAAPIKKYGEWDLRRNPQANDCGNLNAKKFKYMTLRTTKSVTAFNVKVSNHTSCKSALVLIMDKHLKGFKSGKRTVRGQSCAMTKTTNSTISRTKKIRAITCRKRSKTTVRWQVVLS
jgi:Domain of unknown function (DUF1929)